jgi:hypothetical protein
MEGLPRGTPVDGVRRMCVASVRGVSGRRYRGGVTLGDFGGRGCLGLGVLPAGHDKQVAADADVAPVCPYFPAAQGVPEQEVAPTDDEYVPATPRHPHRQITLLSSLAPPDDGARISACAQEILHSSTKCCHACWDTVGSADEWWGTTVGRGLPEGHSEQLVASDLLPVLLYFPAMQAASNFAWVVCWISETPGPKPGGGAVLC